MTVLDAAKGTKGADPQALRGRPGLMVRRRYGASEFSILPVILCRRLFFKKLHSFLFYQRAALRQEALAACRSLVELPFELGVD